MMMYLTHQDGHIAKSKIVVISGPSAGVGKDTVVKIFRERHPDWVHPISTTTRQPRPGEVEEKRMNFVNVETFKNWQKNDKFIETAQVNGNYYGTLKAPVDSAIKEKKNLIIRVDVNGALKLKKIYPNATLIFIIAASDKDLESRLRKEQQKKKQK